MLKISEAAIIAKGVSSPSENVRIPGGHPEGYLEAFATLYSQFAEVIRQETARGDTGSSLLGQVLGTTPSGRAKRGIGTGSES